MKVNNEKVLAKSTISWNLDENGVLHVDGSGKIPDCDCGKHPSAEWDGVKNEIFEIHIADGITEIGINAFKDCKNLQRVVLAGTVRRIHANAFWGCLQLNSIETSRHYFKYVYDEHSRFRAEDTVVFGVEAFHDVPWSRAKFGDFYILEDKLYATFAYGVKKLVVPEGVRVLKSFSMNFLDVDSIVFPKTLEVIEDFAFSGSKVKEIVELPEAATQLSQYALAGCSIKWLASEFLVELAKKSWKYNMSGRERFPKCFQRYSVGLESRKAYGKFKKIKVQENKFRNLPDGVFASYIVDPHLSVGESVYRRMRRGNVVLCITCRDERIQSVKSFVWDGYEELVNEYLLYPTWEEDGHYLVPWRDSFTYQDDEDIIWAFDEDDDGDDLIKADRLRLDRPDVVEEWFYSSDWRNFGGPLELKLLKMWLSLHPQVTVDSDEENMEKDKCRMFVSV